MWMIGARKFASASILTSVFLLVFDGKGTRNKTTFRVSGGITKNIHDNPTKFLGSIVCRNQCSTKKSADKDFSDQFTQCLNRLNVTSIRGEYKVWIHNRYLVSSLHYKPAVNSIPANAINKSNSLATKYIKSWMGLHVLHPWQLSTTPPYSTSPTYQNSLLKQSLHTSQLLLFQRTHTLRKLVLSSLQVAQSMLKDVGDVLSLAVKSVESINRRTLPGAVRGVLAEWSVNKWNMQLQELSVQRKFGDGER